MIVLKKYLLYIIIFFIIAIILVASFFKLDNEDSISSTNKDVKIDTLIDDYTLHVNYENGNMIDEVIPYGNKVSKVIVINNSNKESISFAINISEVVISDQLLTYTVRYKTEDESYIELEKDLPLIKDDNIAYNLVIPGNSNLSVKIDFYGNNEINNTEFKGKIKLISNLSEKDIFRKNILAIQKNINTSIDNLNGITEKGYFIYSLNNLGVDALKDFQGFVLIDSRDYSDLKFYYFTYDKKYMLNNVEVKNSDVDKKKIEQKDESITSQYSFENVCKEFTKKGCQDFQGLTYNENGGKGNFYTAAIDVINKVKESTLPQEKKVYIYDVTKDIENTSSIRGYILVDNTKEEKEYYLYITNNIYMITGYNLTKLGSFNENSKTIRTYLESSYNLSSENMAKVCSFSGFTECYLVSGEKVI